MRQRIREALQHPAITLLAEETTAATEQHVNLMDPGGNRISLFVEPPASQESVYWTPIRQVMAECDVAVVNILDYAQPALAIAQEQGKPVWTDLHDYDGKNTHHQPFIDGAEVLFLSSDNLADYRRFMQQLIACGKKLVVCTHGRKGATLIDSEGRWLEQPAYLVEQPMDTNGAGDAFFSGFLAAYLDGESLQDCLRLGAACGALGVASRELAAPDLCLEDAWALVRRCAQRGRQ